MKNVYMYVGLCEEEGLARQYPGPDGPEREAFDGDGASEGGWGKNLRMPIKLPLFIDRIHVS